LKNNDLKISYEELVVNEVESQPEYLLFYITYYIFLPKPSLSILLLLLTSFAC